MYISLVASQNHKNIVEIAPPTTTPTTFSTITEIFLNVRSFSRRSARCSSSCLHLAPESDDLEGDGASDFEPNQNSSSPLPKNISTIALNPKILPLTPTDEKSKLPSSQPPSDADLVKRLTQLEGLVARQAVEIRKLREECRDLSEAALAFSRVVDLLREAGLAADVTFTGSGSLPSVTGSNEDGDATSAIAKDTSTTEKDDGDDDDELPNPVVNYESFDDPEIFGTAPSSIVDAADAAGAAILAAVLAGKRRMLVDVRDAELSRDGDGDALVQFIELAILPVAAGLEGLKSERNRVKIVFPTVGQLLQYRRTMALAAPEVVALSTLGFDPLERKDNIVVIVAPAPDDEEGHTAMDKLLTANGGPAQPLVVLNHHMFPPMGPAAQFDAVYHLRLLSVQYMTGDVPTYMDELASEKAQSSPQTPESDPSPSDISPSQNVTSVSPESELDIKTDAPEASDKDDQDSKDVDDDDVALEAAMERAHELGIHHGVTRAMVIRAYPRPWHVFVDTSPDTDADFEVAATFDDEPSQDDINHAIVECLEGSEREDELVAQQMQAALAKNDVSGGVWGWTTDDPNATATTTGKDDYLSLGDDKKKNKKTNEDGFDDDGFYNDFDAFNEDSC